MEKILISLAIGAAAGVIDIIPMILKKLNRYAVISAFTHYLIAGFIVCHIDIPIAAWWIKGGLTVFLMSLPIAVVVYDSEPKSVPIILSMAVILGSAIGAASHYFAFI